MNRRIVPVLAALAALVATLPLGPTAAPARAAGKPDLVVKSVEVKSRSVVAGGTVKVADTTKNIGSARAGASRTAFYLSTDQQKSKVDHRIGTRKVGRLAAGAHSSASTSLTVPGTTKARGYWVIVCADDGKQVVESKEGNNCRTSATKLTVTAGSPGIFPQTPNPVPPVTSTDATTPSSVATGTYRPFFGLDLFVYDGPTTYHLHLPGDLAAQSPGAALQGEEDVTMTVLSSVSGLPPGTSLLAGVRLEPEGLQLANPGTLTISGPALTAGNLPRQTGAVFNTDGADLSMSPILPPSEGGSSSPGDAVLAISHFSSPTVLDASAAGRQYLLDHPPARVYEQLQAKAADRVRTERLNELANPEADPDPAALHDVIALYNDYFDHQVVQELNAALSDDKIAGTALDDAFRWERFVVVNGGDPGARGDLITTLLPKIVKNAIDKAWARCAVDHHLSDVMTLLGVARWAEVLGDHTDGGDAYAKALACGHFQAKVTLDVTHSYHFPAHQFGTFSQDVDGHWATKRATLDISVLDGMVMSPLQYDPGQLSYSDVWKDYEGTSDCPVFVKQTDLTSTVDGTVKGFLYVDINPYEVPPGVAHPPVQPGKIVLTFAGAHENYHWHYTQCGSGSGDLDAAKFLGSAQAAFTQGASGGNNTIKIPIDPAGQVGATLYNDVYERTWDNHAFLHEIDTAAATVTVLHTPQSTP